MKVSVSISIEVNELKTIQDTIQEMEVRGRRKIPFSSGVVELARLGIARKKEFWSQQTTINDINIAMKPRANDEEIPKRVKKKTRKSQKKE